MDDSARIRVGIVGVSGYAGLQLTRLLLRHPRVTLSYVGDRDYWGKRLTDLYPELSLDPAAKALTKLQPVNAEHISQSCELVFLAEAHGFAWSLVPSLLAAGCRVIDLSADYRFSQVDTYEAWYQDALETPRTDLAIAQRSIYGLPELYRDRLATADIVGCPGCYPTASLLAIAPLFKHGLVVPESTIIDAKCGLSEGGKVPKSRLLFAEAANSIAAYAASRHRATPEIEHICHDLAGHNVVIQFTPHRIPTIRGVMATTYATLRDPGLVREDLITIYQVFYRSSPWVHVLSSGTYPQTRWVQGTNACHIGIETNQRSGRVTVIAALDNLLKGQAGQAIQCMNIMMDWDETLGLPTLPQLP